MFIGRSVMKSAGTSDAVQKIEERIPGSGARATGQHYVAGLVVAGDVNCISYDLI